MLIALCDNVLKVIHRGGVVVIRAEDEKLATAIAVVCVFGLMAGFLMLMS